MGEPVNRTILLFDTERFSHRDDVVQAVLRRSLNAIVDQTLVAAGVEATLQYREDRGDGMIVLLGADVAKTAVLRSLLTLTPELLHDHNRLASRSAQMRLRMVLAAGEITHDPHAGTVGGIVGHDLNQACRLLDSDALRTALAERTDEESVLMVSTQVYEGVVRHGYRGVRPEHFERIELEVKDGVVGAWLHNRHGAAGGSQTGDPSRTARPRSASHAAVGTEGTGTAGDVPQSSRAQAQERPVGAVFHFHGTPEVHGSIVGGDQHGVSGGRVTGDVVLGGVVTKGAPASDSEDGRRSS
ncbi:hypothetical protein B4N89_15725 [Embleya scabrispora]|uniref:Guanylate cyclase domain-containing protein n=1 Tax=Embleya scabrispora TaxID=159449 RepID=A0A1T3NZU9_9ACTN|nr:hypothetical protein [Embleya scabrispora]OPC82191.1 hypothetical protein B4N89_15725 [Embleya scabrispora]